MADYAPDSEAQRHLRRVEGMRSGRSNFDFMWQEVRDNVIPVLARFIGQDPAGVKSNQYTLDETPEQANELLTAALQGMIANPALKWFEYGVRNPKLKDNEAVAAWLARARDITFDWMYAPTAGLTAAHHESFLDLTAFGTGCLFTGERPGKGLLYQSRQLREIYLAEGADGRVDTVYRWYNMSARQAKQKWATKPGATLPPKVATNADNPQLQDKPMEFLHCVYPRSDAKPGAIGRRNMPVASIDISVDDKATIEVGGYHEMPYAVPRWIKRGGEVYGRGPGTKALPSCKALQRAMKINLGGAELAMRPPLQVADDGVSGNVRFHTGALNFVRAELLAQGRDAIKPIQMGTRPEIGDKMMEGMRERIQTSFYNHLIQMSRDPRMTATQVIQIAEETLRVLGPVIGRLQAELLGPQIERTFWVLFRIPGVFPPLPKELHGEELIIEYVSPIAQGQKLSEAKGIVQTFGVLAQMSQVDPSVMDNLDLDGSSRALAVMFGTPRYLLRDPKIVADLRQARAKKQQEQEQMQMLQQAAKGIKDASGALPNLREGLGLGPLGETGGQALAA